MGLRGALAVGALGLSSRGKQGCITPVGLSLRLIVVGRVEQPATINVLREPETGLAVSQILPVHKVVVSSILGACNLFFVGKNPRTCGPRMVAVRVDWGENRERNGCRRTAGKGAARSLGDKVPGPC